MTMDEHIDENIVEAADENEEPAAPERISFSAFVEKIRRWLRSQARPGMVFLEISDPDVENDRFSEKDYIAMYGMEKGEREYRQSVLREAGRPVEVSCGSMKRYTMVPEGPLPYAQDGTMLFSDELAGGRRDFQANKVELHDPKDRLFDLVINLDEAYFLYTTYGMSYVKTTIRKMLQSMKIARVPRKLDDYRSLLTDKGNELFEYLRQIRAEMSREMHLSPFIIFTNRALYEMCVQQPGSLDELMCCYGVSEKKAVKYGAAFLAAIRQFTRGTPFIAEAAAARAAAETDSEPAAEPASAPASAAGAAASTACAPASVPFVKGESNYAG